MKIFEDIYMKCLLINGLIPYLASAMCTMTTNNFIMIKILNLKDFE